MIKIEEFLPLGGSDPVTREQLCLRTGLRDRELRREISAARLRGVHIVSSGTSPGYYLAKDEGEKNIIEREYLSRAMECLKIYNSLKRGRQIDGQQEL